MSAESEQLSPVEILAEEFLERQQRGEEPTIGEYCEKHPELAGEIREVFEALAMMEELKPDSHDATGTFGSGIQSDGRRLERVGDYRILREIGRGGMGVVYEAEQESLGRRVALKVLPRRVAGDEKALVRFQREARAAARMHHTNIVPVFDVGEDADHVFYAMQMIQGQGLDLVVDDLKRLRTEHVEIRRDASADRAFAQQELEQRQSLAASLVTGKFHQENLVAEARRDEASANRTGGSEPVDAPPAAGAFAETILQDSGSTASAVLPGQSQLSTAETNRGAYFRSVAEIGLQTARALSYAHARGIIHRDIKPSNLLLDAAGVVWVTDFGLAKTSDEAMTHTGDILGTIRYMSPERFKGQCDVRADLYSLGLTLYELLVLRPAFASPDRLRLIELVSSTEPPTPRSLDPRIPRDLETVILKLIDKDPRRRYQSADELCEDLERFIQDEPIKARRVSLAERLVRWSRRNKPLAAALATVCALLLVINIAGPILTWQMKRLNDDLKDSQLALKVQRDAADNRADENAELARQRDIAAQNEKAAADKAKRLQELTRRNLYVGEINMAQLAGLTGDFARREDLLSHWQTTDPDTDLRGIEYYLLAGEGRGTYREIRSHSDQVSVVAWSPDGTQVASAGRDGEIHVCDAKTGEVLQVLAVGSHSLGLAWSPDGSRLLSGSRDGVVRIWDVVAAEEVLSLRGHSLAVFCVAWEPGGERVASAGFDGIVRVWDVKTGEQLASLGGGAGLVFDVAWHPEGGRLAWVGDDSIVHVWDAAAGGEIEQFTGHSRIVFDVDWNPDGVRLASTDQSGHCFIWRSGERAPLHSIEQEGGFSCLDWSPDGQWLAVSDRSNGIRIYNGETAAKVKAFRGHDAWLTCLDWSGDWRRLASSSDDGSVRIWEFDDADDAPHLSTGADVITASDWSPDGRYLVTGDNSGKVRRWEVATGDMVELVDPDESLVHVHALRFSPDGTLLAAVGRPQNEVLVWETATGELVQRLKGPPLKINQYSGTLALAWDSEQDRLAAGNSDGVILLWNPRTGEPVGRPCNTRSTVHGLSFIPHADGRWLISGHENGRVNVWDLSRSRTTQTVDVGAEIFDVAVTDSGTEAAVGGGVPSSSRDQQIGFGIVRVWNVHRNDARIVLEDELTLTGPGDLVRSLQFSPDERRLVAGGLDGKVHVWDITGELTDDVRRHVLALDAGSDVETVRMSTDGIRLTAGGSGGNVRIWDALEGYAGEFSPLLLPVLERKVLAGTATRQDELLRAAILSRQGNWSAAGASFDRLFELPDSEAWCVSDLWVLDGAFSGDLEAEYPPERIKGVDNFDVLEPVTGPEGEDFHWRPREYPPNTMLDFGAVLGNRTNVSGYALLRVYASRDEQVGIVLRADDQDRLWLNGKLIDESVVYGNAQRSKHGVPVELQRGWNTLLAKVTNSRQQHGLMLTLTDDPGVLAPVYEMSGETEAAGEMWDRAVALHPNSSSALIGRAEFLWNAGEPDAAEWDFERVLELPGSTTTLLLLRARTFARLAREDDALIDLDRAVELTPDSPALLIERGNWRVRLGRLEAGAMDLQAAIALNPTDHFDTFHLTSLLLQIGDISGYERLRRDMLARWGESTDPTIAERTTKACLLYPLDEEMLGQLDALMEATQNVSEEHRLYAFFLGARGMLEYRHGEALLAAGDEDGARGRFQLAQNQLASALSRGVRYRRDRTQVEVQCRLYRAMALDRLGQSEEALRMLQAAEESLAGDSFPQPGEQSDSSWPDEFMARITYREAAALILGPAYRELLEGERLLGMNDVDHALEHLTASVVQTSEPARMLQRAQGLLVKYRVGYVSIVPNSRDNGGMKWEYRFTLPAEGWNAGGDHDDSSWKTGPAAFGSHFRRPEIVTRTPWPQSARDIWLRVRFDVVEPPAGALLLRAFIDEKAEVFINGIPAATGGWAGAQYQELNVSPESAQAIRSGSNVLAVHCSNGFEGCAIDVGLYAGTDLDPQERLLTAALAVAPESPELLRLRGADYLRRNDLEHAADDYFQAAQRDPGSSLDLLQAASLLVAVGDVQRYRQICEDVLENFAASSDRGDAEHVVKICSILPQQDDSIRTRATRVAVEEIGPNPDYVWAKMSALLSDYRRQEFQQAIDRALQCLAISREEEAGLSAYRNMTAFAYVIQAMSYRQLGDHENSRAAFQKGLETCSSGLPEYPEIGWWDTFISRALLDEAAALINGASGDE